MTAAASTSSSLIDTKTQDFLENDDPVRGQNYVCVSFISPEDAIRNKEAYFIKHFLKHYIDRNIELYKGLASKFPDKAGELEHIKEQHAMFFDNENVDVFNKEYQEFKEEHEHEVTEEFSKDNGFQTSIRGIKVRGSYETVAEAQARAETLRIKDRNLHNIYIAEVGCWCPWSANPNNIDSAEYTEAQLNTLMKEYKKNKQMKDSFYNERKQEMMEKIFEEENTKTQQAKSEQVDDANSIIR